MTVMHVTYHGNLSSLTLQARDMGRAKGLFSRHLVLLLLLLLKMDFILEDGNIT